MIVVIIIMKKNNEDYSPNDIKQAFSEIPGDIGVRIEKEGGIRSSCARALNFRGAIGSRLPSWEEPQPVSTVSVRQIRRFKSA